MLYQSISTHSATREAAARETATRETATGEAAHSAHTLACLLVTHRVNLVDDVYKSILVDGVAARIAPHYGAYVAAHVALLVQDII